MAPKSDRGANGQITWDATDFGNRLSDAILNATITWHFLPQAGFYFAIDNISNAAVATSETGNHVYTYDEPRAYRVGLTVTF